MTRNQHVLLWPDMAFLLTEDLRWLVENQAGIVSLRRARPMVKTRPVKAWPDGRVRIEFVGTYESAAEARQHFQPYLEVTR